MHRRGWKRGFAALLAVVAIGWQAEAEDIRPNPVRPAAAALAPEPGGSGVYLTHRALYRDSVAGSPFEDELPAPIPEGMTRQDENPPSTEISIVPLSEEAGKASAVSEDEGEQPEVLQPVPVRRYQARRPAPPQPWHIPQPRVLESAGITLGGWIQQGITLNGEDPADRYNGPVGTNDRSGEWQVNQMWMFLNKPIDNNGEGWDLGGRLDMIYGSDARFGVNWGLENRINGLDQPYGLVIPQMYAEVAYNDVSVKLGHFAGILSYEQVPAVANFFYSHSYAMYFTEPLLVTGALANVKLTDQWSVQAGFHRGWMMWEDLNDDCDFMGGIKWSSLDGGTSLSYAVSVGPQDPVAGSQNRFASSFLLQHQLNAKLRYVLQSNMGFENNGDPRNNQDAEWYGLNQYLFYTINEKWAAGMRIEWLRDDDGLFYGPGNVPGNGRAWAGGPGFAGDWFEVSCGLNWRPCPNVVVRPELRYDTYNGTRDVKGDLPFDNGNKSHQFTAAADLIFTY